MEYGSTLVLILVTFSCTVHTFNLEPRIPVIKKGSANSYFGFSVAEHQELRKKSDDDPGTLHSWMLVGAPKDDNMQPGTNKSGALWKCPMSTSATDCEQVITDGRKRADSDRLYPPDKAEEKNDQWMGVTVRSQGVAGKIVVCAHRYVVKGLAQGLCYILSQDFKYKELKKPCSGESIDRMHEEYAYCQAGTSSALTSKKEDQVVIGVPGSNNWKGIFYVLTVSDQWLTRDNERYKPPINDKDTLSKYSNLGMSVTVGYFLGKELVYAVGAPRAKNTGQVFLFTLIKGINSSMDIKMHLDGEQFGSCFGYEMTSANVNGDEFTDLIVAAPFYFDKDQGGAVYVYTKLCKNSRDSDKCNKPLKLVGREAESRFGFALTNLQDINKDGYEDIAVGAPYEGKGTVYVYLGSKNGLISTPSQIIHAEDTPRPFKTFGYSLSGGLDMDGNGYPDLLVGAYEENSIMLLRARKIIDIMTSVRFYQKDGTYSEKMEPIDPNKITCPADLSSNYTCFTFEACCEASSIAKEKGIRYLRLKSFIEAETYNEQKKFSRVWFGGSSRIHYVSHIVTLDMAKPKYCQAETVYLKDNVRDIQSPIKFRLNYTLVQDAPRMPLEGENLTDINNYPILNQQEAARVFKVTFQKDCGNNDICESDLRVRAKLNLSASTTHPNYYELLLGESEEVVVDVIVENVGESAYEAEMFVTHSTSLNYIASKSNGSAICSLYNTTMVSCDIGNPFKKDKVINIQVRFDPKGLKDSETELVFNIFANSTSKEVEEKEPTKLQATVLMRAELSIKGSAKTQLAQYGGPVIGESAIKHLNEVGPKVSHIYEVFNEGPWKVSTLDVKISWPYEVANDKAHGKWLLYLEEMPTVQALGGGECYVPHGQINPLNLTGSIGMDDLDPFPTTMLPLPANNHTGFIRRKRDTEKVVNTKTIIDKDGHRHQVVSMNCNARTAKCFHIICTIRNLEKKQEAIITLKARLWNSTLVEDYPKVDQVKIGSNARIIIPSHVVIQQENLKDDFAMAETIANSMVKSQKDEPVPIWIIIVAIMAGLLLLVLLTLVLWKLGFFKRRRPDPTLSGNLEKHREDNPESEALFKH